MRDLWKFGSMYLPQSAKEKEHVTGGFVDRAAVGSGPGVAT
jgi:hypothetical protein